MLLKSLTSKICDLSSFQFENKYICYTVGTVVMLSSHICYANFTNHCQQIHSIHLVIFPKLHLFFKERVKNNQKMLLGHNPS